jgi:hypothetical protein
MLGISISRITLIVLGVVVLVALGISSKAIFSKSVTTTMSVTTTSAARTPPETLPQLPTASLQGSSQTDAVLIAARKGIGSGKLHQYTPHGTTLYIQYACEGRGSFELTGYFKISSCPQEGVALLVKYSGQSEKSATPRVVAPKTIRWILFISSGP